MLAITVRIKQLLFNGLSEFKYLEVKHMVTKLKYGNTNTFFVRGTRGNLLIDTDYAGTLTQFYKEIKKHNIGLSDITYVLATHYHPDHIGLVSELMKHGVKLILIDSQIYDIHFADDIFARDKRLKYEPINGENAIIIQCKESMDFLRDLGIEGEIISTPSHSNDSISVVLDDGTCFVGDLEPIDYINAYDDNVKLKKDWELILSYDPKIVYYAHANEKIVGGKVLMETQRLIIREMMQPDLDALCKIMCDEEVMRTTYESAFTVDEVQGWLNRHLKRYEDYGFGLWAVVLKETNEMIGQCGLTIQEWNGKEILEIGYLFQKAYWHKGYATEAAIACKEYAFDVLNASSVYSTIRDTHIASQNVAVRNGMKIVDRFTKNFRYVDMNFYLYAVERKGTE